jgi:YD repeat-containing protein
MDRTAQEVNPLSQSVSYTYDQASNLATRTDRLNQQCDVPKFWPLFSRNSGRFPRVNAC